MMINIIAMGFQFPGMWAWSVAVAIPIILHLLHRSRSQQMDWAAMQFIERALAESQARVRLNQWLRLLTRMAVILLVVTALAGPRASNSAQNDISGEARTYRVIVIDSSFSMSEMQGNESTFDLAIKKATEIIRVSDEGDGISLILLSDAPELVISTPAFDHDDVVAEVVALEQLHGSAQLQPTLERALELMSSDSLGGFGFEKIELIVITDGDHLLWSQAESEASKRVLDEIHERAVMHVHIVREVTENNLAITGLTGVNDTGGTGNFSRFSATVKSYSAHPVSNVQLTWRLDGKLLERESIALQPGESQSVELQVDAIPTGSHVLECHINGDNVSIDNHRWLSFTTRSEVKVLLVEGTQGDAEILQLVFDPEFPRGRTVVTRRIDKTLFASTAVFSFDAIVLCDVPSFDQGDIARLSDFLQRGGTVFIIAGDSVNVENYNQWSWEPPFRTGLIPGDLGGPVDVAPQSLSIVENGHSILQRFDDDLLRSLEQLPVQRIRSFTPNSDACQSLLVFEDAAVLYTVFRAGAGTGFFLATDTSSGSEWSEVVTWPVFLPLIHESLKYAMQRRDQSRNFKVGDLVRRVVSVPTRNARLQLTLPNEQQRSAILEPFQESSHWSFEETLTSGVYLVEYDEPINKQEQFVVNVSNEESDIRPYDGDIAGGGFDITNEPALSVNSATSSEWYRIVLGVVVVLLIGEWYSRPDSHGVEGA